MILIFSDLHLHNWSYGSTVLENGINSRLQDQINIFKVLHRICELQPIKQVVFCGDLFHVPGKLDSDVVYAATKGMADLAHVTGNRPICLVGNHDFKSKSGHTNSVSFLYNICTIISPGSHVIYDFDTDIRGLFISYTDEPEKFQRLLSEGLSRQPDFAFLHQGVRNVSVGKGFEVPNEILSSDMIPDGTLAFTGHYHKHKQVSPNLVIVGSPMQHTWGDSGDDLKGFILLDETTGQWTFNNVILPPKFKQVPYDSFTKVDVNGHFIRVIVPENFNDVPTLREKIMGMGARSVEFIFEESKVEPLPIENYDLSFAGFCKTRHLSDEMVTAGTKIQAGTYEITRHRNK